MTGPTGRGEADGEHVVLVDRTSDWKPSYPSLPVITAREYLTSREWAAKKRLRIINLCTSYRYLRVGYYCSLLAEARGHKVIPPVRAVQDLARPGFYAVGDDDLDQTMARAAKSGAIAPGGDRAEVLVLFGSTRVRELASLAREAFAHYRCPALKIDLRRTGSSWKLHAIRSVGFSSLGDDERTALFEALSQYLAKQWGGSMRTRRGDRYDMAILRDVEESMPPSNPRALERFQRAARSRGVNVEFIDRRDYGRLAEFDALFIRETTRINHHTYRFAARADREGLVVIDDPESILKCANKVYLAELLQSRGIRTPRSMIVHKDGLLDIEAAMPYPVVLKVPDGSFSRGVFKVDGRDELLEVGKRLLDESELIIAQAFTYTEWDWRVGVLVGQPLFACRYFMAKKHWQIVQYKSGGEPKEGPYETLAVEEAPAAVIDTAVRAARLIGDGLYGVDLKETADGVLVIEINDNPNIDAGVEDKVLGTRLYETIVDEFIARLDRRVRARTGNSGSGATTRPAAEATDSSAAASVDAADRARPS